MLRRLWRRFLAGVLVIGIVLGGVAALVSWVAYQRVARDLEAILQEELWPGTGRVYSGPLEVWSGMMVEVDTLAGELRSAGYEQVENRVGPGQFRLVEGGIDLIRPETVIADDIYPRQSLEIRWSDGRISNLTEDRSLVLGVVELTELRGPDNETRTPVSIETLPPHLVQAVLAMEDSRFYEHEGLDPLGIARAIVRNLVGGGPMQGGSTLTQQVIKNLILTPERTVERKAEEALYAVALERLRDKDAILELYLNEIYWGQTGGAAVCGVDQAAQAYFGKPASRLSILESATLAGIISAPNRYSPLRHPEEALVRRNVALSRMVQAGYLLEEERAELSERPLEVVVSEAPAGSWMVSAAIERVETDLGQGAILSQSLSVYTTLRPVLQGMAERAVRDGLEELAAEFPLAEDAQAALVAIRASDGEVLAMVGGRNRREGSFNRAMHARRHLGSTIKPLTALLAFDADPEMSPSDTFLDAPIVRSSSDGSQWRPENYDHEWVGIMTLREAVATSRNIPAILLAESLGMEAAAEGWRSLGLTEATSLPSAALGAFGVSPMELAEAYSVIASGGFRSPSIMVRDVFGEDESEFVPPAREPRRVTSEGAAFLSRELLLEVVRSGTGASLLEQGLSENIGGKTGTTDEARDAWFAGIAGGVAIVVWVGLDRGEALGVGGGRAALPIWGQFVQEAGLDRVPNRPSDEVAEVLLCPDSGQAWLDACPEPLVEWFRIEGEPDESCWLHGEGVDEYDFESFDP